MLRHPYHAQFRYNPTLRLAHVLDERLPREALQRTAQVLTRPFGGPVPVAHEDKIQKRRRHKDLPTNYLEQAPADHRMR